MPTAETKTIINADINKVWSFLNDLKNISNCIGVAEEIEMIDEKRVRWVLKSQQARTARTREVEAQFTTMETNRRLTMEAKGGNLKIEADCELQPREGKTECKIKLTFDVSGALGTILKPMISMTIGSRLEAFIQCLKEHLEK